MSAQVTVLHEATKSNGIITKIIRTLGHTFKMVYECTNGTSRVTVLIMTADGQFAQVLSHVDLGGAFDFKASYVSDISSKAIDAKLAFKLLTDLIVKIY